MPDTTEATQIACTLDGGDFQQRMAWIADLNTRALLGARRDDLRLELDYTPAALTDVRQMVAQEQACCAFLSFGVIERPDAVTLSITAPEAVREAAEAVLGPFQEKTPQAAACGCTSGCGA